MKSMSVTAVIGLMLISFNCESTNNSKTKKQETMQLTNKEKAVALVQAFETGSSKALYYVSDEKYIQHNLSFPDGKKAIVGFFGDKPTGITVKVHRVLEEGNFVALHSTYGGVWNNGTPQVAFDVFRFENGLIVEHWDNLLDVALANPSGRTQTDGTSEITDKSKEESNKSLVNELMKVAFIGGDYSNITKYISPEKYLQHNPSVADGLDGFNDFVGKMAEQNIFMKYANSYQVIADGNFVLTLADGTFGDQEVAYYDLFRLEDGLIVEHWDIVTSIPPKSEWQNQNGKF